MTDQLRSAILDAPRELMQRVVDEAVEAVRSGDGAVLELAGDDGFLTYVCTSGTLAGSVGMRLRWANSLSGMAMAEGRTMRCDDSELDARVDREACRRLGIRSMVCVPLHRRTEPVGVLKVSSARPNGFDEADVELLDELAGFITTIAVAAADLAATGVVHEAIEATGGDDEARRRRSALTQRYMDNVLHKRDRGDEERRDRVELVLREPERIEMVGQPVIDLTSGRVVGIEALARFRSEPSQTPDVWFADAARVGLGVELELLAVARALAWLDHVPDGVYLAVNVGPDALVDPRLRALVDPVAGRIVLELTEHERLEGHGDVSEALGDHRARGARLAIDDAGAGFSGLTRIVQLDPDVMKLDRQLIIGIDEDPARMALAAAMVAFAARTSTSLVAEGIETDAALATLRELGVGHGQGYLIGRPEPFASLLGGALEPAGGRTAS